MKQMYAAPVVEEVVISTESIMEASINSELNDNKMSLEILLKDLNLTVE